MADAAAASSPARSNNSRRRRPPHRRRDAAREARKRYAKQLVDPHYGKGFRAKTKRDWLDQATRQVEASGGRPVRWYFAEEPALEFARKIFGEHNYLRRIELVYAPPPWGDR